MEDKDFKPVVDKAIEHLYEFYELDHMIRVCVSHDTPEELLTKEQFIETMDSKWELALNVLITYISKQ